MQWTTFNAEYRGIAYRVSRNDDGTFESTVFFADGTESASYSREDMAVAGAENLIDDNADMARDTTWDYDDENFNDSPELPEDYRF